MMKNIIWNLQHLNSSMAGSRKLCKNKNYFNLNSMNGLVLIACTMVLMFSTQSSSTSEPESIKVKCSDLVTCTTCTIEPMCIWSLEKQACGNKNQLNSSSLIVSRIGECPQFSVVTTYQYIDKPYFYVKSILTITNDLVGFVDYLNSSKIYMGILDHNLQTPVRIVNKTAIAYSFSTPLWYFNVNEPSLTYFTIIKFNDIMLRFDNVTDHYITVYEYEECANEKYKPCATCGWNKDGYWNYLKWCSSDSTCKVRKNLYMRNNATKQLDENVAYVTNYCSEINVTAVDPLYAPKTGGTTVTITVRNHRIFAEDRTLKVTVAGTVCTNPETSGLETITCTTSQVVGALFGPVIVEYSLLESSLKIESSQIFQFCRNPILDADQQLGGVVSGGTSVPVHGDHFVETCFIYLARLYVDLNNGVRRYAESYCDSPVNNTYMVCRSPRANDVVWDVDPSVVSRQLNFGLDITLIEDSSLNYSQPIAIQGSSLRYYVHPDPVLSDFEIDESGSLVVNGFHLKYVQPEDIVIRAVDSPSSVCVVVLVIGQSWVCKSNMSVNALQVISVTFGDSLVLTVNRNTFPHSDDPDNQRKLPGWFLVIIAMPTALVFICALAYCLRKKHQDNMTENVRNPQEAFTRLQDL